MSKTTNCRYCGHNIIVAIALLNTGTPDVCDNCAIEQMEKRRDQLTIETLATKVMGWEVVHHYGQIARKMDKWTNGIQHLQIWNPLQNITDAWMIVEKLTEDPNTTSFFTERQCGEYNASFVFPLIGKRHSGRAETASKAISMAAFDLVVD